MERRRVLSARKLSSPFSHTQKGELCRRARVGPSFPAALPTQAGPWTPVLSTPRDQEARASEARSGAGVQNSLSNRSPFPTNAHRPVDSFLPHPHHEGRPPPPLRPSLRCCRYEESVWGEAGCRGGKGARPRAALPRLRRLPPGAALPLRPRARDGKRGPVRPEVQPRPGPPPPRDGYNSGPAYQCRQSWGMGRRHRERGDSPC